MKLSLLHVKALQLYLRNDDDFAGYKEVFLFENSQSVFKFFFCSLPIKDLYSKHQKLPFWNLSVIRLELNAVNIVWHNSNKMCLWKLHLQFLIYPKDWAFATNSKLLISMFLHPDGVNLW